MADEALAQLAQLLVEAVAVGQDTLCPVDDPRALGGEALESPATLDDGDGELRFELLQGSRQRWLRYPAGNCGAAEMALASERAKINKLAQKHGRLCGAMPLLGKA